MANPRPKSKAGARTAGKASKAPKAKTATKARAAKVAKAGRPAKAGKPAKTAKTVKPESPAKAAPPKSVVARTPRAPKAERAAVKAAKDDGQAVLQPEAFRLAAIERTEPPAGGAGKNWYRYTIRQGGNAINGYLQGTAAVVKNAAEQIVGQLNERRAGRWGYRTTRTTTPAPNGKS